MNRTYEWCHHSDEQKVFYTEELINSKFVLCPRGNCPASIRLFKTMKMGRVPVILSDDWAAPDGPTWLDFSIRVSESKIHELPGIIEGYEAQALTMGNLAREA
ncbi:exostosin family protein [Microcoleus sp. B3-A4]